MWNSEPSQKDPSFRYCGHVSPQEHDQGLLSQQIELVYRLDERGSIPGKINDGFFSLFVIASRPALRFTQPPMRRVPEAHFPGVKRTGREAYHSRLSRAEVKNALSYTSTPQYVLTA
jgi:hypothetical protein